MTAVMTDVHQLKEQIRQARDRLKVRSPRRNVDTCAGDASRVWRLQLEMALEQNYVLEQRLAWEIEQRNRMEEYTRQQIRQLQQILEMLIKQQALSASFGIGAKPQDPPSQPTQMQAPSHSFPHSNSAFVPAFPAAYHSSNNLSPLLTEVMHVQLKFAETMQSLNQSVQVRDSLLNGAPLARKTSMLIDDSDAEDDTPTLSMATYTDMLNRNETPPSLRMETTPVRSPRKPFRPQRRDFSPANDAEVDGDGDVHVGTPAFMSPWAERPPTEETSTPATDESKRLVHFEEDMTTPTIGRAISFQDCNDDDDDFATESRAKTNAVKAIEPVNCRSPGEESSITSSQLDRSSFLAEFERFRQSVSRSARHDTTVDECPAQTYTTKAQWSLEAQRLSAERALMVLEQSASPSQLAQLDEAITFARSQVLKFS